MIFATNLHQTATGENEVRGNMIQNIMSRAT